jgi:hypothetical protein
MILFATSPTACGELAGAFSPGVTTRYSDTLVVVASHCETTRLADGAVVGKTIVNWSGLAAAAAVCIGAWLLGAVIGGRISPRKGGAGIALALALIAGSAAAFFD